VQINNLGSKATAAKLVWGESTDNFSPPFDIIIASDVCYQTSSLHPLVGTLASLSSPHTVIYIANEHRDGLPFSTFGTLLEEAGFGVHEIPFQQLHPDWRTPDIQLYQLTPPGGSSAPTPQQQ
jgi:predicted nicotinamide N-methyase